MRLPNPPTLPSTVPHMMTASELQRHLEQLFDWLHMAEAMPELTVAEQRSMEAIRDVVNLLLDERRERHSDENSRRGG